MKYKYRMSILLYVAFLLVALLLSLSVVYNVLKIFNVGIFFSNNLAFEIVSIVACLIGIFVCISATTTKYTIKNDLLKLKYVMFDILGGKCLVSSILNVLIRKDKLYLSFLVKGSFDPQIIEVVIDKESFDSFCTALTNANPNIIVQEEK